MRENNGLYEYIAVYVDDLLIAAKKQEEIISKLQEEHKFKLKGVGPLTYHLDVTTFVTTMVLCVMDQGSILSNSWINMKACMDVNQKCICHRLKRETILK